MLLQKLVRIGDTDSSQKPKHSSITKSRNINVNTAAIEYGHTRNNTTFNMPINKYSSQLRNSDNSLPNSSAQAKSFDTLDFNEKLCVDYGFESNAKSKSFDDDICYNIKVSRNAGKNRNVFSGNRVYSQDVILLNPPVTATSKSLRNSPKNYGSRLYDHNMLYDIVTRNATSRSPILNYNTRVPLKLPISQARSPDRGRRRDRERNSKNNGNYQKPKITTTLNRSPNRSLSDSDDSINDKVNKVLKNKSLIAEYLFGLKRKQQTSRSANRSGTNSSPGRY